MSDKNAARGLVAGFGGFGLSFGKRMQSAWNQADDKTRAEFPEYWQRLNGYKQPAAETPAVETPAREMSNDEFMAGADSLPQQEMPTFGDGGANALG